MLGVEINFTGSVEFVFNKEQEIPESLQGLVHDRDSLILTFQNDGLIDIK